MQLTLKIPPSIEERIQVLTDLVPIVRHQLLVAALRLGIEQLIKDPTLFLNLPKPTQKAVVEDRTSISGVWE